MKDLFSLLPTVHRVRDAAQGDPLRALMNVVNREVESVEDDIGRLYDNWFIETCDEWVVPYIADLARRARRSWARPPIGDSAFSQRSYVANTLAYRRRKGTAAVLEQLATRHHRLALQGRGVLRAHGVNVSTSIIRARIIGSPSTFGTRERHPRCTARRSNRPRTSAEMRHIDNARGRYNVPNVGLFLWRLQSYFLRDVSARRVDAKRYTFDPLGRDVVLFNMPQTEAHGDARDASPKTCRCRSRGSRCMTVCVSDTATLRRAAAC